MTISINDPDDFEDTVYVQDGDEVTTFIVNENNDPDFIVSELGTPGPQGEQGPKGDKGDTGSVGDLLTVAPLSYDHASNTIQIAGTPFDANGAAAAALAQANAYTVAVKNTRAYTYQQQVSSQIWNITHNLGTRPAVVIVDTANQEVFGDITYSDNNSLVIKFTNPFSGTAYLI